MNRFIRPTAAIATSLAMALSAIGPVAHAHGGAKAQHGGIVQTASDLSFELVAQGAGSVLYVVDHDKPADTSKFSGKLTVLQGGKKEEAELKPAGGNKMEAAVKLGKGAKAVATVKLPHGATTTVRFAIP